MSDRTRSRGRLRAVRLQVSWALLALGLLLGCGPQPTPAPEPDPAPSPVVPKPAEPTVCKAERPAWVDTIPGASREALFVVGSGVSRGGESHARRKATFDAREELARQLRAEVSTLVRRVGKELQIEDDQGSFEAIETFSGEQYAEQSLLASAPVQFFRDPCGGGRVWVLMRLPLAGLEDRIWAATRDGFDKYYADNAGLLEKARALFDDAERRAALQSALRGADGSP